MERTYCGKICAECEFRESMNCPGCANGPGKRYDGDCELAECCRSKGHETCETCAFQNGCNTLRNRGYIPKWRQKRIETECSRNEELKQKAEFYGTWMWFLFWMLVPNLIAGIMTMDEVVERVPVLLIPGLLLQFVCNLVTGLILMKMGERERQYRTAGVLIIGASVCSIASTCLTELLMMQNGALFVALPGAVFSIMGMYNKYMAHASLMALYDRALSERWRLLWKWYIGLFCGLFGGLFLIFVSLWLGAVALIGVCIALIVVSVNELVTLYRSAKLFREYQLDIKS